MGFPGFNATYALTAKQKSPAEIRGAFDLNIVMRFEAFRPWQTWQRPTLPGLEA
jgi:hypothetical protein